MTRSAVVALALCLGAAACAAATDRTVSDDQAIRQLVTDFYGYEFDTSTDEEWVPLDIMDGSLAAYQYAYKLTSGGLGAYVRSGDDSMVVIVGVQMIPNDAGIQHAEVLACGIHDIELVNPDTGSVRSLGSDTPEFLTIDAVKGPDGWRLHDASPFEYNGSRSCDPDGDAASGL